MNSERLELLERRNERLIEALKFFKIRENGKGISELLGYIEKGEFKEVR